MVLENSFGKDIRKKIKKIKLIDAKKIDDKIIEELENYECLIIDSYKENIDEKLLYSILNQAKQLDSMY